MKAIYIRFNRYAGFGREQQGDLFSCACRLGWVTVFVCRVCLVERLQQLKALTMDSEQRRRDSDGQ